MEYYVYIYLDPTKNGSFTYKEYAFTNEPFYVGKGTSTRLNNHLQEKRLNDNSEKSNKIKNLISLGLKPIILKIKENLTSNDAYLFEGLIINAIGKKNDGRGPLLNKMGSCENGLATHSIETKRKIGLKSRGRKHSISTKEKCRLSKLGKNNPTYKTGKYCDYKPKFSRSEAKMGKRNPMFGVKLTSDQKLARSTMSTKRKSYEITHIDGSIEIITGILKYCRDNNLSARAFRRVLSGERTHYKGMKIKEVI